MIFDALAALTQALLFAGLLSCAGAVFSRATLGFNPELERRSIRLMRRAAVLSIAAALASALILVFRLGGSFNPVILEAVFLSVSGAGLILQAGAAFLLLASFGDDRTARSMRLANACVMSLSFAFHGHASGAGGLPALLAVAHAGAASWWIGSLWLLHHACNGGPGRELSELVLRFSSLAVRMVGVLVLAGLIIAMMLIGFAATPLDFPYLKLLAVKVLLAGAVLAMAAYNKYRLTPRLVAGDAAAVSALRGMIRNELIGIGAVLMATAVLTTYTTPYQDFEGLLSIR